MTLQHIASAFTHIPKMSQTLSYANELSLNHLPIGMPVALLSHSELRRLRLIEVITTFKKTLPNLILLEDPDIGWGTVAYSTIQTIIERSTEEYDASWILVRQ
jgi:excinuclease UvrABC ATPase subunit